MEMPTCKEKGETGEHDGEGGGQRRGRDIGRCLQTPTTRRRRWRGEMQKWIQLGCKRTRAALFNSLPDAVWKSAHRGETKASQSLSVSHIHTLIQRNAHARLCSDWRCSVAAFFPEIGIHCYVNGNRQSRLRYFRRHLRTESIYWLH